MPGFASILPRKIYMRFEFFPLASNAEPQYVYRDAATGIDYFVHPTGSGTPTIPGHDVTFETVSVGDQLASIRMIATFAEIIDSGVAMPAANTIGFTITFTDNTQLRLYTTNVPNKVYIGLRNAADTAWIWNYEWDHAVAAGYLPLNGRTVSAVTTLGGQNAWSRDWPQNAMTTTQAIPGTPGSADWKALIPPTVPQNPTVWGKDRNSPV